jgi:hypothetical protein
VSWVRIPLATPNSDFRTASSCWRLAGCLAGHPGQDVEGLTVGGRERPRSQGPVRQYEAKQAAPVGRVLLEIQLTSTLGEVEKSHTGIEVVVVRVLVPGELLHDPGLLRVPLRRPFGPEILADPAVELVEVCLVQPPLDLIQPPRQPADGLAMVGCLLSQRVVERFLDSLHNLAVEVDASDDLCELVR